MKRKLLELIAGWTKTQKTKIGEAAREEIRQVARLGQKLVVMELS